MKDLGKLRLKMFLTVLGNSYGFCVASVRALYQKAAAMALAAEAQAATASHPRRSQYRAWYRRSSYLQHRGSR